MLKNYIKKFKQMSLLDKASLIVTPNAYKESKLYSVVPSSGAGDMDVVRATTATRVNSAGLIESVAINIPRIDYTNGSCPSLLVEPQRSNQALYSEQFDNASWSKIMTTITPNTTISPSGVLNADTFPTASQNLLFQTIPAAVNTAYTISLYVKLGTATNLCLVANNSVAWNTIGGKSFTSADGLNTSTWTKISYSFTTPAVLPLGSFNYHIGGNSETGLTQSTGTVFIWGAQVEAGSYPTSYIPTVASAVTRNADVISKTGISSLIGQTEGTMFLDLKAQLDTTDVQDFSISDGTTNNRIIIRLSNSGIISAVGVFGGSVQFNIGSTSYTTGTRYKIALAYKNNDVALYINGTNVALTNTFTISGTLSRLGFDVFTNGAQIIVSPINSAQLYKTRLTNTELAQLTTL